MSKNISQISQINIGKKGVLLVFTPASPLSDQQLETAMEHLNRQAINMATDMMLPVQPMIAVGGTVEVIPVSNSELDERLRKVEEWIDHEDTRALEASEY